MTNPHDVLWLSKQTCSGLYPVTLFPNQYVVLTCLGTSAFGSTATHCVRPEVSATAGDYSNAVVSAVFTTLSCFNVNLDSPIGTIRLSSTETPNDGGIICFNLNNQAITDQHTGLLVTLNCPNDLFYFVVIRASVSKGLAVVKLLLKQVLGDASILLPAGTNITIAYQII